MRFSGSPHLHTVLTLLLLLFLLTSLWAAPPKEKVLYSFPQGPGGVPYAGLVRDTAGNLYGTTTGYVQPPNNGNVFELSPTKSGGWKASDIYAFAGGSDGQNPYAPLIQDAAGNLYGTTVYGGNGQACIAIGQPDCGTVFKLTRVRGGWSERVLYSFQFKPDGAYPTGGLVLDNAGNLYGATTAGGSDCSYSNSGCGTIFQLTPNSGGGWTETVIHSFTGPDGANPWSQLVFDRTGNLYGTAWGAGVNNSGVVYKLASRQGGGWKFSVIHRFTGGTQVGNPDAGLTLDKAGNLYGTAMNGGTSHDGTVYELKPTKSGAWKEIVLHTFKDINLGACPESGVIFDPAGNLYGVSSDECVNRNGTAFQLQPTKSGRWTYKVLHTFGGTGDGSAPTDLGKLAIDKKGHLYGTTGGGGKSNAGTVFEITP